jgi:hypothetical protein
MASGIKVVLPGATATISMNYVFVLIGIAELGFQGTLIMGCLGMLVQCLFYSKSRPKALQVLFSVASMACSVQASYVVYGLAAQSGWFEGRFACCLPPRLSLSPTPSSWRPPSL